MWRGRNATGGRLLACLATLSIACADDELLRGGADASGDDVMGGAPTVDAGVDGASDASVAQLDGGASPRIAFSQAIHDAFFANPTLFDTIPIALSVTGTVSRVRVRMSLDVEVEAARESRDRWVARFAIRDLVDGDYAIEGIATTAEDEIKTAPTTLRIGRTGVQLTDFATDGPATMPRIHRVGDAMFATFGDRSLPERRAWMREIDGAGRFIGDRVPLGEDPVVFAPAAFGKTSIGVLAQSAGHTFTNHFRLVSFDGVELIDPIPLDPSGRDGGFGGDIAFDGEAFVVSWRTHIGEGGDDLRWMRFVESTHATTGPVVLAEAGDGQTHGGFEPFAVATLAAIDARSMVGFVRARWNRFVEMAVPKSQLALRSVSAPASSVFAGPELDLLWHFECRVFSAGRRFLAVWSALDLGSMEDPPHTRFYGAFSDENGDFPPRRGRGEVLVDAPGHRSELAVVRRDARDSVLAWLDQRSLATDRADRHIELSFATMSEDLRVGEVRVIPHARLLEGTSQLFGVASERNALLVWIDARHGGGITDPRPEIWFETLWF